MKILSLRAEKLRDRLINLVLILIIVAISSCKDGDFNILGGEKGGQINFTAQISEGWRATRSDSLVNGDVLGCKMVALNIPKGFQKDSLFLHATTIAGIVDKTSTKSTRATPLSDLHNFNVSAYCYSGDWSEDQEMPLYFSKKRATKENVGDDAGLFTLSSTELWPQNGYKMRFFAFWNNDNNAYSYEESVGSPRMRVTVPNDVANQEDLLVATSGEIASNYGDEHNSLAMNFTHPMTAVKFVCGDDMDNGTIESITLKNVCSSGVYEMSSNKWDVTSITNKANFNQSGEFAATGANGDPITSEAQTFMMIPQTLGADAEIEVVFRDQFGSYTLRASIGGQEWLAGTTVTYRLSTTSINKIYVFEASAIQTNESTMKGGMNVTSYCADANGNKVIVPVTMTFSDNNGMSWSKEFPKGIISVDPIEGSLSSMPYYVQFTEADVANLKNATPVGMGSTAYNLSNSRGDAEIENTANCYVVSAPGRYRIPLVYGNAIKNGAVNPSSYKAQVTGTNVISDLINHNGNAINGPYIYEHPNCTPSGCRLEWQTGQGVLKNWKLDAEKKFLEFEVDQDKIVPGNALISVLGSGGVMWSWHIWITAMDTEATVKIAGTHQVMALYLGQRGYNGNIKYKVLVKLSNGREEKIIPLTCGMASLKDGYPVAPLYMFGKKDPAVILTKNDNNTVNIGSSGYGGATDIVQGFSNNGSPVNTYGEIPTCIGSTFIINMIKNPTATCNGSSGAGFTNIWDNGLNAYINNISSAVETKFKTIYDPSPVGFCVLSMEAQMSFNNRNYVIKDNYGHVMPATANSDEFWMLELGFFRYRGTANPLYGTASYLISNAQIGSNTVWEMSGGRFYTSGAMWMYNRAAHVCHQVYCEREK